MQKILRSIGAVVGLYFLLVSPTLAAPVSAPHITVELLSEKEAITSGESQYVGILFKPEAGWHIYWKNPGDSGLPPRTEWETKPRSMRVGPLEFPTPDRIPYGPLVNFGYNGEVLLLAKLSSETLTQDQVEITVKSKWLVCKDECVPGKATLELKLPVVSADAYKKVVGTHEALFKNTIREFPKTFDLKKYPQFRVTHSKKENGAGEFVINVVPENAAEKKKLESAQIFFFPEADYGIAPSATQAKRLSREQLDWIIPQKEYRPIDQLKGILKVGSRGYDVIETFKAGALNAAVASGTTTTPQGLDSSLALMLLFAFVGGLILNLMPCILPVLSIKVMELVRQGGDSKKEIQKHGVVFTLGILVSFWVLAAVLLIFRAGGSQLGWGFQLQSPVFVACLVVLFSLMGLNLMGAFEVGTRIMGVGGKLTTHRGYRGSFFTGVLTTIAATPCSAPFMGTALGFALSQSAWIVVSVLTVLALGLAFPFLVFSFYPGASRILPRPGQWMETFRQFLSFPLFATAIWLVSVLSHQAGSEGVVEALSATLVLYGVIWLWGKTNERQVPKMAKWSLMVVLTLLSVQILLSIRPSMEMRAGQAVATRGVWQPFDELKLKSALAAKKTVIIDITADWCVTCKVNESLVFENLKVKEALESDSVVALFGDWTNGDQKITEFMARYGRNSVPVYLLFKNGASEPEILPQILTPKLVLEKLGVGEAK